jgi:dephospho-CoA kinase
MSRQATREQRLAEADFVVPNDGTPEELSSHINACWEWINELKSAKGSAEAASATDD